MKETFPELVNYPIGIYQIPRSKKWKFWENNGWIAIEKVDELTVVSLTSNRNFHDPHWGTCYIIDLNNQGEITSFYKTILSLWMVWYKSDPKNNHYKHAIQFANSMLDSLNKIKQINKK